MRSAAVTALPEPILPVAAAMTSDPDRELMIALKEGESPALNALMRRWEIPLRRFIYRYVQNESDALDLAQETFVRVFRNRHRYRPECRFSTWLFTIAVNLCRSRARSLVRRPTESLDAPPASGDARPRLDTTDSGQPSPADHSVARERAAAVRAAIDALPRDMKEALLLFEYEDLSYEEIAGIVGSSVKAVESRLYRARALLRKSLAGLL